MFTWYTKLIRVNGVAIASCIATSGLVFYGGNSHIARADFAANFFVDFTQGSGPDYPGSCDWNSTYTRQINVGPARFTYGRICGAPNNTLWSNRSGFEEQQFTTLSSY